MADTEENPIYDAQSSPAPNERPAAEVSCSVCGFIEEFVTRSKGPSTVWVGYWKGFIDRVWCETCQRIVRYFEAVRRPYNAMSMS
jgi:hypothetical protein